MLVLEGKGADRVCPVPLVSRANTNTHTNTIPGPQGASETDLRPLFDAVSHTIAIDDLGRVEGPLLGRITRVKVEQLIVL